MIELIARWVRLSGPEWTVERLKALKLEYITRLAGEPVLAPRFRRNKEGYPSGVWSFLMKRTHSPKQIRSTLHILMVYSSMLGHNMTKKQKEKFFGSMLSKDTTGLAARFRKFPGWFKPGTFQLPPHRPFILQCKAPSKSALSTYGVSIRQDDSYGQFAAFCHSDLSRMAVSSFPLVFQDVIPVEAYRYLTNPLWAYQGGFPIKGIPETRHVVGKLGFIQEPGYKLRAIANPNAVWQASLNPLKELCLSILKVLPTDCTHDQTSGVLAIQDWLKDGKTCYSVDLSDATNLMPRHLQIQLLKDWMCKLIVPKDKERFKQCVEVFDFVSGAPWYFKDTNGKHCRASFRRGQPLGLGPSFPVFALTHNIILWGICQQVKVPADGTYRILGDDVVISHPEVHRIYRETLRNLGCKVSEAKCLVSAKVAEFAGYIITCNELYQPLKWREVSDMSFIDIARNFGKDSYQWFSKTQRKVLDTLAPLPEDLGGLGWNPHGLPLDERLSTPVASWFLDRALLPDKVIVRYRTLDSLNRSLWSTMMRDEEIKPFISNEQISLMTYLGLVMSGSALPTRESCLNDWHSPLLHDRKDVQTPEYIELVRPIDRAMAPILHREYGYLVPLHADTLGDPRRAKYEILLNLLDGTSSDAVGNTFLAYLRGRSANEKTKNDYLSLHQSSRHRQGNLRSGQMEMEEMKSAPSTYAQLFGRKVPGFPQETKDRKSVR
jgi:hypothetical protein